MLNNSLQNSFPDEVRYKFFSLPKHKKEQLLLELQKTFLLGIRSLVVTKLPYDSRDEFRKIAEAGNDDEILLFGYKHIPNFQGEIDRLKSNVNSALATTLSNI